MRKTLEKSLIVKTAISFLSYLIFALVAKNSTVHFVLKDKRVLARETGSCCFSLHLRILLMNGYKTYTQVSQYYVLSVVEKECSLETTFSTQKVVLLKKRTFRINF